MVVVIATGEIYANLDYSAFCAIVYHVHMDLANFVSVCNRTLSGMGSCVLLELGKNIIYSGRQEKTINFKDGKILLSAKSIRRCRDANFIHIPKNVVFMVGSVFKGVGYLVYDKYFKGKRLGLEGVVKGVTQSDIFAKEFANIMLLRTNFANCSQVVSPRCRNTILVVKALQEKGFNIN